MTDTTPHRATAEELRARIEALESSYETMRLAALEWGKDVDKLMRWSDQHLQRIEALEAGATCPHIVSSDEGTSYCGLAESATVKESLTVAEESSEAEQQSDHFPDAREMPSSGSLVERVALGISRCEDSSDWGDEAVNWAPEARAAIRVVAAALYEWQHSDSENLLRTTWEAVRWLEQEAER